MQSENRTLSNTANATMRATLEPPVGPYTLPALKFSYTDLEPIVDTKTMQLHHGVHHQGYIDGLNRALELHPQWYGFTIEELLRRLHEIPEDIRPAVRDQGGGHANHQFFWKILTPHAKTGPSGDLAKALIRDFGSVDAFRAQFEAVANQHFGAGWVFLVANPANGYRLEVLSLPNHYSVLTIGRLGLLVCDLWEHAYYLKHHNRRADWLRAWWQVVDWDTVDWRFHTFLQGHQRA
jgi:Fe-Mn family superoxide dismutase